MKNSKVFMHPVLILTFFIILMVALTLFSLPYVQKFSDKEFLVHAKLFVSERGFMAWAFVLLAQMVQVVIAFIPGEPFEIVSGVLYGTIGGLGTCLLGCALASSFIFFPYTGYNWVEIFFILYRRKNPVKQ